MKSRPCKSIAGLALAMATGFACAHTVTFDEFPRNPEATDLGDFVISNDFGFVSTSGSSLFAPGLLQSADPLGSTLLSLYDEAPLLVGQMFAGPFRLVSLDLAGVPDEDSHEPGDDSGSDETVQLTYWVGNNSIPTGTIDLDIGGLPGLHTFQLGLQGVSYFALDGVPFQLDNLVTDVTSPVPEPSSGVAMLAGLALLGSLMRRRRA